MPSPRPDVPGRLKKDGSGAKTFPALGATPSEHGSTVPRGHSRPETVSPLALEIAGLKGPFHRLDSHSGGCQPAACRDPSERLRSGPKKEPRF